MTESRKDKSPPRSRRDARRAAALRENLRRRKLQIRGRERGRGDLAENPQETAGTGMATSDLRARAAAVRDFWFGPPGHPEHGRMRRIWFEKDEAFDAELRARFLADYERAATGAFDFLADTPEGALALVILLDQLPRNLFRGEARAYATDAKARDIAARAVAAGLDMQLSPVERLFVYLPFEHSEDITDQRRSVALFESLPVTPEFSEAERANVLDYARRHLEIIERFGRFPHRNAALGRKSTPEEIEFLKQPDSSF